MSFSKAAQQLGLSKAYVSGQISTLEKTMKAQLILKNTRNSALTVAGKQLFAHC